jgi:REP element-mobilizing transposase RayT
MAEASVKNVSNYDGDVIRTELLHKIPSFIPSKSQVQVTLVFNEIRKDAQLWLNIPNLISDAYYTLRYSVYCMDQELYNMNLTKDDLVDIYNYMFVTGNVTRREQLPKISNEIIDDIVVDKTSAFFKKHASLFDPKIIEEVASKDEYVNWKFLTDNVKEPELLRESVKKNFSNIEKECDEGKCYIIGINNVQEYMDQEIINFVIKLMIKHARRYKDWILEQINDDNIHLFKEEITKLSYLINLELFKSKASSKIINQYIRESDIKDVQPFRVSKYKSYFSDAFEQETVDVLLKDVEVDTVETLTKFRKILSREAWNIKKNEYFEKEHEKVDQLKLQIEKELD